MVLLQKQEPMSLKSLDSLNHFISCIGCKHHLKMYIQLSISRRILLKQSLEMDIMDFTQHIPNFTNEYHIFKYSMQLFR